MWIVNHVEHLGIWQAISIDLTQQLLLQNELPLLILLCILIRLIILPSHHLSTLLTCDITHDMAAGGHVTLAGFALLDVDHGVEEVGFAMLAAEILQHYVSFYKILGELCGGALYGPYL